MKISADTGDSRNANFCLLDLRWILRLSSGRGDENFWTLQKFRWEVSNVCVASRRNSCPWGSGGNASYSVQNPSFYSLTYFKMFISVIYKDSPHTQTISLWVFLLLLLVNLRHDTHCKEFTGFFKVSEEISIILYRLQIFHPLSHDSSPFRANALSVLNKERWQNE